jgi:hypothetical protein
MLEMLHALVAMLNLQQFTVASLSGRKHVLLEYNKSRDLSAPSETSWVFCLAT